MSNRQHVAHAGFLSVANAESVPYGQVPELAFPGFRRAVIEAVGRGARLSALLAGEPHGGAGVTLLAVLADDAASRLKLVRAHVPGRAFRSLTPDCPQAHMFEREIAEQAGLHPEGHPWLKPVRYAGQTVGPAQATDGQRLPAVTDFYRVEGDEVHEVAVGPVHAGIIEPGHFRFQCHGEQVFHLEIALGYQHRGVERALAGGPDRRSMHHMETLSGDTTVGHATAYCQALEALAGVRVSPRAWALRGIALELERLANHTGDLGALANDVGFLPTASYCGRLRGDFLNMSALLCGSRFGRGMVRPGGVGFDVDAARAGELLERLEATARDVANAVNLLWDTPSVMARFEETGTVSLEVCQSLGLVGPAARACAARRDVRQEFPTGIYAFSHIPVSTWHSGDVFARAYVRWLEIQQSVAFIREQVQALPEGAVRVQAGSPPPGRIVVSLIEGWRGEICHVVITDGEGRFARYKVVDPSFHNWTGLAMALRDQQISDFPLCNKSFNLSYCGHDL
ncbi:MAG: formate hydrogenase HycE [Phycisphaerae bacterium]